MTVNTNSLVRPKTCAPIDAAGENDEESPKSLGLANTNRGATKDVHARYNSLVYHATSCDLTCSTVKCIIDVRTLG